MRALVVYCHPDPGSFNAAICSLVCAKLREAGAELRLRNLYAENFQPVLSQKEWHDYLDPALNTVTVTWDVESLRWCDTLIFIYPTWWYGPPAMLKGWLDRVMVPEVAFLMPDQASTRYEQHDFPGFKAAMDKHFGVIMIALIVIVVAGFWMAAKMV